MALHPHRTEQQSPSPSRAHPERRLGLLTIAHGTRFTHQATPLPQVAHPVGSITRRRWTSLRRDRTGPPRNSAEDPARGRVRGGKPCPTPPHRRREPPCRPVFRRTHPAFHFTVGAAPQPGRWRILIMRREPCDVAGRGSDHLLEPVFRGGEASSSAAAAAPATHSGRGNPGVLNAVCAGPLGLGVGARCRI